MDVKEKGREVVEWIRLPHVRDRRRIRVNTVTNLLKRREFDWISYCKLLKRHIIHGVR
jgi:hypothetical protein